MCYHAAMASMKKTIDFNEYWDFLRSEAASRGWTDLHFMRECKIPRQRYYEFGKTRFITGLYMAKLMEGLGLKQDDIEQRTKKKFTPEQVKALRRDSWVAAHSDIIDGLVDYPELVNIVKQQIELQRKK